MKIIKILITATLLLGTIFAQNINGRISSNLYMFENYTDQNNSDMQMRAYQLLNLNVNQGKFSLRTRLNFETDFSNSLDNDPRLRFYNLYLEGRNLLDIVTVKLGRQTLINSFGGLYDGISLKFKHSIFTLKTYYGGNVPAYQKLELTDDLSNDNVMGAKLSMVPVDNLLININYIDKNYKPEEYYATRIDADLNTINYLIRKNSTQYSFISGDVSYSVDNKYRIFSRYDYDLNYSKTSKFEISGRVQLMEKLGVTGYYNYREPRLAYNSIFSVFNYGNSQEIEAGLDYKINNLFTVFGKFANVEYEDDNSGRVNVGFNSKYGSISYRKTFGYAGEMDAISAYAAKTIMDGVLTPSAGLSYSTYKLSEETEKNTLISFHGGVNYRPWKSFSFDLQAQYFNNEIYKDDFRILFKFNHWFNTNLSSN